MSNRKVSSFTVRFFWPLMLCLGLGLMALVGLMSYRSDLYLAARTSPMPPSTSNSSVQPTTGSTIPR